MTLPHLLILWILTTGNSQSIIRNNFPDIYPEHAARYRAKHDIQSPPQKRPRLGSDAEESNILSSPIILQDNMNSV